MEAKENQKRETYWAHNWIYVIIPVSNVVHESIKGRQIKFPANFPLFCAYCKNCNNYYTEPIKYAETVSMQSPLMLPKWGCIEPQGV